jgi:hypothetical protein
MTPREVETLTGEEYAAMVRRINRDVREQQRQARAAKRRR